MKKLIYLLMVFSTSCKVGKHLSQDQKIYAGSKVYYYGDKTTWPLDLKPMVEEKIQPKENSKIFSYPYKVANYYLFNADAKKPNNFVNKFIEKPIFFNDKTKYRTEKSLLEYLQSRGFFKAEVNSVSFYKKNSHGSSYYLIPGSRYIIDTVKVKIDTLDTFSKDLYKAVQNTKFDKYFDLENIIAYKKNVELNMRGKGYHGFRPDFLSLEADTLGKNHSLNIIISQRPNISISAKKQFQINDIHVFINEKPIITADGESEDFFRGLLLNDSLKKYKEKLFVDAIAFRPGTLYNHELESITTNRLLSLSNFRLINSSFSVVNSLDSTLLDNYYYLQTLKSKSFRLEANAINRSSGLAGSQLSVNWLNLNTFKAAELLKFSLKANFEFQIGGKKNNISYPNNYRLGFDASLNLPRLWVPKIKIDPEVSKVLPKTQLLVGYETFLKTGLYNLNSARASLIYSWTKGRGVEQAFKPFSINILKSSNISSVFLDEIFSDPKLLVILENQFIAGGSYEFTRLPVSKGKHHYSYTSSLDFAGNFIGLVDLVRNKPAKKGSIFDEYFAQFWRAETEFRYKYDLGLRTALANRFFLGLGIPYGNSLQLPFPSQFYVGGNNSLRSFRARGIGPGAYKRTNSVSELFLGNNTGDIKLEINTEYRLKVNSLLSLATFLDAGNVWMYKDTYIYGKEALFTKNFLSQMALGTGLGFRFDFSFVIFRLDIGTPLHKPYEEAGSKWTIKDFNLKNKDWRQENIVWNVAIGLPF